jgi:Hydantoinase/oxoprolinase
VCLVDAQLGGPYLTNESTISGVPIGIPMLDIHTAGAGGGSLACFDSGSLLRVGPESAGAVPVPICFGRGSLSTVTDANLILGRVRLLQLTIAWFALFTFLSGFASNFEELLVVRWITRTGIWWRVGGRLRTDGRSDPRKISRYRKAGIVRSPPDCHAICRAHEDCRL